MLFFAVPALYYFPVSRSCMFLLCLALVYQLAPCTACDSLDRLDKQVRDGKVAEAEAQKQLAAYVEEIKKYYVGKNLPVQPSLYFPLQGYDKKAIGGNGSGYQAKGYRYFDGNKHKAHPAHDIFIYDKNQDGRDDNTGQRVNVRSMSQGIVVAVNAVWEAGSAIRGGKYIWVFDVRANCFYYYAHLGKVFVKPGDILAPGAVMGTLGRTGANASLKRSPTHLHFGCFELVNHIPVPKNVYDQLLQATTK